MSVDKIKTVVIPYMKSRIIQIPTPLPHYVQMTIFIPITKCFPKFIVTGIAQHARDVREWRYGVQ